MRWVGLTVLGLAIAGAALYALASRPGAPGHAEIDDASRAALERVLREAEPESAP